MLSAVVPDQTLSDFAAWMQADRERGIVTTDWRPAAQRVAALEWNGTRGVLRYVEGEGQEGLARFVPGLIQERTFEYVNPATHGRGGEDGRHVAVVAAGMGHRERGARVGVVHDRGGEGDPGCLAHRERVHVGAERDDPVAREAARRTPRTPCPAISVRTSSRPSPRRCSVMRAAVPASRLESSGLACSRWRTSTSAAACAATRRSSSA
jgi:hypothetical protein